MVERPIKKSERQAVTKSNDVGAPNTEPSTTEGAPDIPQSQTESSDVGVPNTEPSTTEGAPDIPQSLEERSTTRPLLAKDKKNDVGVLNTETSATEGAPDIPQSLEERSTTRPLLAKDKKKVKGREDQRKDEQSSKPPMNLALMRGPKPTKPKPPVIPKTQEETSDSAPEEEQEET